MSKLSLSHKPVKLTIIITLAFIMLISTFYPVKVTAQTQTDYYYKQFEWDYNGDHWEWNLTIPKNLYDTYKAVPVSSRVKNGPEGYGFLTTTNDYYLQMLAEKLNETSTKQGYNSFDEVSFILAFVQSLLYTSDNVTSGYDEYPRFPIETLVDDGGDCEDTSILFATLTLLLDYGTVYINPPNHYAVGILGNDIPGSYWTYNNKTYYYSETTGNGFKIGQIPDEFKNKSAYIYSIKANEQYVPNYQVLPTEPPSPSTSPSPTTTAPTIQPLSFEGIFDYPIFLLAIFVIVGISIAIAVFSAKRVKEPTTINQTTSPEPTILPQASTNLEGNKFCIFCGASNKMYAVYCEKCGQKIG